MAKKQALTRETYEIGADKTVSLTESETEIIRMVTAGKSMADIAEVLGVGYSAAVMRVRRLGEYVKENTGSPLDGVTLMCWVAYASGILAL